MCAEPDTRDVADVAVQLDQLVVAPLRVVPLTLDLAQPRLRAERRGARTDAAALLRELGRLARERLGLLDVERDDRVLRDRLDHDRLEILAALVADELERLAADALDLGEVAAPRRDHVRGRVDVEARVHVVVVAEHLGRAVDQPLREIGVGALVERDLAERRERASLQAQLARNLCLGGHAFHLFGHGVHVEQPPRRVRREVAAAQIRIELGGSEEERARGPERLARQGATARAFERGRRRDAQVVRCTALELLAQRERAVEVVRADLHQLVAGAVVQPVRERLVQLGARRLREAGVRDLGDQDVFEPKRALAGDRRAVLDDDELTRDERVEQRADAARSGASSCRRPARRRGRSPTRAGAAASARPAARRCAPR